MRSFLSTSFFFFASFLSFVCLRLGLATTMQQRLNHHSPAFAPSVLGFRHVLSYLIIRWFLINYNTDFKLYWLGFLHWLLHVQHHIQQKKKEKNMICLQGFLYAHWERKGRTQE